MLMRAGLSGRQVLAVLVAFGVFYAAVGLIGAGLKLSDRALFAPWIMAAGIAVLHHLGPGRARAPQAPLVEDLMQRR
jgi:hypothetical protein